MLYSLVSLLTLTVYVLSWAAVFTIDKNQSDRVLPFTDFTFTILFAPFVLTYHLGCRLGEVLSDHK